MKKLLMLVLLISLSSAANAAGIYDGIWQVNEDPEVLISIHENNGTMVAFSLDNDYSVFNTGLGTLNGNTIIVSSLDDYSILSGTSRVVFTSATTMYIEQLACESLYYGWECKYPNGTRLNASKIF